MLQRTEQARRLPNEYGESARGIDLVDIYAFLKSRRRIIAGWTFVGVTVALVYAFTATPLYTATAELALDSRKIQVFKNTDQVVGDQSMDSSQVESEVEVLRSESIAREVIKELRLTDDPEFVGYRGGAAALFSVIFGANQDMRALSDAERERLAIRVFSNNLSVRRVGLTYVLEISYRSPDPQKAAKIANAAADAYINDQLDTKYQAAKRASVWLQERIAELRGQSNAAAHAVQDYMEKNNIVDTGDGHGLLSNQQLQQLNTQMINATAATAEAKARYDRVEEVLNSSEPGDAVGTVSDTLNNPVITRLRQHYLDDRERAARFTALLGPTHIAVVNVRNEMAELQNSIVDELRRIAQSYKSDYEIAKTREDSLRVSLAKQVQQVGTSGQAQVDLKELEAASQTYHTIFENFLQKYTEAVQQQSFPISDARVITPASPPRGKSYPKTTLVALLGLMVGLSAGLGHSLVLINFDRTIRRPRDAEERLGLDCLGTVPLVVAPQRGQDKQPATLPFKKQIELLKLLLPSSDRLVATGSPPAKKESGPNLTFKVIEDPFSHFSEGLRSAKTALDIMALTRPMQCIGVISAVPGEGKSTISVNLANLFAAGGQSTLLIDADMRNPELSRRMGTNSGDAGLLGVIAGIVPLAKAMRAVPRSKLSFVPTVLNQRIANSGDLLASERMRELLTEARHDFNRIIVDLPPLGPVSDSRAISPLIDGYILVVKWGATRLDVLEDAIAHFGVAADKILGIVLNQVNFHEMANMDAYSHGYYYNKHYAKYGYTYGQE